MCRPLISNTERSHGAGAYAHRSMVSSYPDALPSPTPLVLFSLAMVLAWGEAASQTPDLERRWHKDIQPILEDYCYDCHAEGVRKGGLELDDFGSIEAMRSERGLWQRIRSHVDQELMPPRGEAVPTRFQRDALVAWIDEAVFPVDPAHPDPGHVTLRRLNRYEYENTIHDLLGISTPLRPWLPPDDSGHGFDNNADALTLSPSHLERLLETTRLALDAALCLGPMPFPRIVISGKDLKGDGVPDGNGWHMMANGRASAMLEVRQTGEYRIDLSAGGTMADGACPTVELWVDGERMAAFDLRADPDQPETLSHPIRIGQAGKHEISLAFINDAYRPEHPDPAQRDRNVMLHTLSLVGPLDKPRPQKPETHRRIFGDRKNFKDDTEWARDIFRRFGDRALRRPLTDPELEGYLGFIRTACGSGVGVEEGIRMGLEAMLVSPSFLFREEPVLHPDHGDGIRPIDEFALASRLSYFLWATMPDERLMALAREGRLRKSLDSELDRMLAAPRFSRWIHGFAGQWLQLRDLQNQSLSKETYPDFSKELARDLVQETEHFLRYLVLENRPLTDLLEADYTFVNRRLAKHYGIGGVTGDGFQKVSLARTPRRGLLGHGSFHMVTSFPLRTSPVLRGKFVLENLLDRAPPPPPPNVPALPQTGHAAQPTSLRAQLEQHRADPNCASCHALMDPIGFSLDCFDADGSYRNRDGGRPLDLSGELFGGRVFTGPEELRVLLLRDHREDILRGVASKMLTYALGRGTEWYDKPALDHIVRECIENGGRTRSMIRAIVHSVPFQYRRSGG